MTSSYGGPEGGYHAGGYQGGYPGAHQGGYQGGYWWNGSEWQAWDPAYPHPASRPARLGLPAVGPVSSAVGAVRRAPAEGTPLARPGRRGRGAVAGPGRRTRGDRQRRGALDRRHGRRRQFDRRLQRFRRIRAARTRSRPSRLPGNIQLPSGGSSGGSGRSGKATAAQQVGVVDIYTQQKYNSAAAAGTGMVLTSSGEVLTNNHVIEGSTAIRVRIVATGKTYLAKVVGTAPSKDVALLQLADASGLTTANLGDSGTVSVGDAVTGVGNAGGVGGTPSAASGKVTALHRAITASDESGTNAERLKNIIVTNAPIQSGDSGGPLYDSSGRIVGMDTAASTNGPRVGFAIPINDAVSIAGQIRKGIETSSIHIGYPGFLGVSVVPSHGSGAVVQGVLGSGPAAKAGISAGDVITRVNTTKITSSTQLHNLMSASNPGSTVSVTYKDPNTGRHTVSVTLATGPAD